MVLYHLTSPEWCPCCFKQLSRLDQALRLTVDSFIDGQECNLELHHWMWCCSGRRNMLNWSWRVYPNQVLLATTSDTAMTLHAFVSTCCLFLCFVVFFAVQMLMLVCFLRMMAVGFLGVQLRQSRGDQMGFALRFRGFDATTCWGGEGCLRRSRKISQAADSLSSTWVEELPAGWVFWCHD